MTELMFVEGFVVGLVFAGFVTFLVLHGEWASRNKLEKRVRWLETQLLCGKGFANCDGGPNCAWSHK